MDITFSLIAGLMASMLHVITGPDHLAAVVPFAIESKKKAWKIGLFWGIGHLVGMLSIGILFMVFKELIPVDSISGYSEQLVGLVLIGIGIWAIYKIFKKDKNHKHLHVHSENSPIIHAHKHEHSHEKSHHHTHDKTIKQSNYASFSIGALHGLAGIAHFLLFLPVLGFDERSEAVLYIVGFGLGTLLAMTAFAFVIGKISSYTKDEHNDVFFKGIRLAGGLFAIVIGIYWMFNT
ncbi:FeoB-associated Cys-rich membrane protein [Maribacter arenosus]|uniref:Sulfite exporter TauE/SafE family protein n=1 Tax=Maribacter arenosus TaxID=1854708 RepID=A0ABR7VDR7_9FLAO|nr:FeoB-associated Cys-rich membrane protein [Maribacter arenosus]MBD0851767.1 sulfite exporter TauE/SafE family protein [Maribacter arenosus]